MRIILATMIALAAITTGCAKYPDSIDPVAPPSNAYANLTCKQAKAEHEKVKQRVTELSKKQHSTARSDAWAVFWIGLPVASMGGEDVEEDLATAKGEKIALETRIAKCA